jgi:hypothetical protein
LYSKSAHRSFHEELELYELLDFDEEGAGNIDVDINDSMAEALLN